MATFKATVQEHHKKADGSYNVKIRVTHLRKNRYLPTSVYVFKEDMTKSLKIKDQDTIEILDTQIRSHYNDIKELGGAIDHLSVDEIVEFILQKEKSRFEYNNPNVDFYEYLDTLIEKMEAENRKSSAGGYKAMRNSLINFYGSRLLFSDINPEFLDLYSKDMKNTQGIGERGIYLYLSLVRATFNFAMKELNDLENDIIKIKWSPFSKFEMPENPTPIKRSVPIEKISELRLLSDTKFKRVDMARDIFMLSFYLCGMNTVDLFNCDKYEDGRIIYYRQKTRDRRKKDKAKMSVKVPSIAKELFDRYKDPTNERVFMFYRLYSTYRVFNDAINIGLNKVASNIGDKIGIKGLQYYAARHSFASIARNRCKLPMDYVSQAMNHSLPQFETTDFYIDEDWSIVDEVQKKVIAKLLDTEKEASKTKGPDK